MEKPNNQQDSAGRALSRIYRLYDDYTENFTFACRKYCADCCTTGVTITSLEGRMIYDFFEPEKQEALFKQMISNSDTPRFQPAMTTNEHARLCREHREPPEEHFPEEPGTCPLLEDNACTIYPVRPFGCRCMLSESPCRDTGSARTDELTLTVNTMFLQFIEHLDQNGFFGNLIDVLIRLKTGKKDSNPHSSTVPNQPVSVLMVPPEHQSKVRPLLNTLNHILSGQ